MPSGLVGWFSCWFWVLVVCYCLFVSFCVWFFCCCWLVWVFFGGVLFVLCWVFCFGLIFAGFVCFDKYCLCVRCGYVWSDFKNVWSGISVDPVSLFFSSKMALLPSDIAIQIVKCHHWSNCAELINFQTELHFSLVFRPRSVLLPNCWCGGEFWFGGSRRGWWGFLWVCLVCMCVFCLFWFSLLRSVGKAALPSLLRMSLHHQIPLVTHEGGCDVTLCDQDNRVLGEFSQSSGASGAEQSDAPGQECPAQRPAPWRLGEGPAGAFYP